MQGRCSGPLSKIKGGAELATTNSNLGISLRAKHREN